MTIRYCGLGGNDANDGLSWANRKLTLNGVEDTPVASGDIVYVGPGVYRELLTVDVSGASEIAYIADVTGEHTDGVGGVVRVTGSDNDQSATRTNCIIATSKDYRTFRGFTFDLTSSHVSSLITACSNWVIEDCFFQNAGSQIYINMAGTGTNNTIRRCRMIDAGGTFITITHSSTVDDSGHLIENCILDGGRSRGISVDRVGGITVKNCTIKNIAGAGIRIATALTAGQVITVNNCLIFNNTVGLQATTTAEFTEDYNSVYSNGADRTNVTAGDNSVAYPPLFVPAMFLSGIKYPWQADELSQWSQVRRIAGTGMSTNDLMGITRPATDSKKSWGAVQFRDVQRETGTTRTGSVAMKLADAGEHQIFVPVTNESTTFSVYVYREADYTGTAPQMIIKQPGQSDTTVTDAGAASQWNQLTVTLTPAATPPYVVLVLKSNNTGSGNIDTFFDDLVVS